MQTPHEEKLTKLFEKYEKESVPGTAYFNALTDFATDCLKMANTAGEIHSFIAAAYRVGFNRGYDAGRNFEKECRKLED